MASLAEIARGSVTKRKLPLLLQRRKAQLSSPCRCSVGTSNHDSRKSGPDLFVSFTDNARLVKPPKIIQVECPVETCPSGCHHRDPRERLSCVRGTLRCPRCLWTLTIPLPERLITPDRSLVAHVYSTRTSTFHACRQQLYCNDHGSR
jgi:hypothetical protein